MSLNFASRVCFVLPAASASPGEFMASARDATSVTTSDSSATCQTLSVIDDEHAGVAHVLFNMGRCASTNAVYITDRVCRTLRPTVVKTCRDNLQTTA